MREILNAFTQGDNQVATMRQLRALGIPVPGGPGSQDGTQDFSSTPPKPTGLNGDGALATIILAWDDTNYALLSHTEVWRAQTDDFSVAQLVGRAEGRVYVDNVGGAAVRYYWIRYVSRANVAGPFNSQAGTRAETGVDPVYLLGLLTNQITQSQLYSELGAKIDLITAPASTANSVSQRIAAEATARAEEFAEEVAARTAAIGVESTARATALAAEAATRAAAVSQESVARANAIQAETVARNAAIAAETLTLTQAIQGEAQLRAQDLLAEAAARGTAISQETTLRTGADIELAERIDFLTAVGNTAVAGYGQAVTAMAVGDSAVVERVETLAAQTATNITAAVQTETSARTSAIAAEAAARTALLAQFAGGYTGNDISQITSGLLYQERVARATQDGALAQQMSLLSAGVGGGFDPYKSWYFDSNVEGWTGSGTSLSASNGNLVVVGTGASPQVLSPVIDMLGSQYATVKARVTRKAGSGWVGSLLYSTAGHAFNSGYVKTIAQDIAIGETVVLDWDMSALTAGGADWTSNTITGLRLDLGASAADAFDIDWIATGRNAPAASVASLSEETVARAQADSAQIVARQALSARVLGVPNPDDAPTVASLSSGLIFQEVGLRTTADTALGTRIDTLTTTVNGNIASITSEASTRATADTALSTRIDTVTATAATSAAAITAEATTRATADTALSTRIDTVTATSNGNTAAITTETNARASADLALSGRIDTVTASAAGNAASLTLEVTTRADADSALSGRIDTLTATTASSSAAIIAEASARATADTALGTRIDSVVASTGANTAAISSEQTARTSADSALSTRIDTTTATSNANTAAIASEVSTRASADSSLSTRIDAVVATNGNNQAAIIAEASTRATADVALSNRLDITQALTTTHTAQIAQEQTTRASADDALSELADYVYAASQTAVAAARLSYSAQVTSDTAVSQRIEQLVATTSAAISASIASEQTVRATADTALGTRIDTVLAAVGANAAAVTSEATARAGADNALGSRIDTVSAQTAGTAAALASEATTRATADGANASAITQLQAVVSDPATGLVTKYAAVKTTADATVLALGKVQAKYVVNVDIDGVAGGFGIIGTGDGLSSTIDFGVRASTFFIAAPNGSGIAAAIPFIVRTTPTEIEGVNVPAGVYIADAFIANGTISRAKIGNLAVDNAKIANLDAGKINVGYLDAARIQANSLTADKIDTRELTIKDAAGNIILGAGSNLLYGRVSGGPPANATAGAAFGVNISGQIDVGNVATFIAPNAITDTQIGGNLRSTNWNGSTGIDGAGWLFERATGFLYCNSVVLRGAIMGGSYTSYAWPATGGGFYAGPEGFKCGSFAANRYFNADANGDVYAPQFTIIDGVATFKGKLELPPMTVTINATLATYKDNSATPVTVGTLVAVVSGGTGPFRYSWAIGSTGSDIEDSPYTYVLDEPGAVTAYLRAKATNNGVFAFIQLIVTDSQGRVGTAFVQHSVHFGAYL